MTLADGIFEVVLQQQPYQCSLSVVWDRFRDSPRQAVEGALNALRRDGRLRVIGGIASVPKAVPEDVTRPKPMAAAVPESVSDQAPVTLRMALKEERRRVVEECGQIRLLEDLTNREKLLLMRAAGSASLKRQGEIRTRLLAAGAAI